MSSWSSAAVILSMKSASICRSAGARAARGMIGLVGSLIWSVMYHTNPAYLGFVCRSLSNSTSSGRGVFGSAMFAYGRSYRRQTTGGVQCAYSSSKLHSTIGFWVDRSLFKSVVPKGRWEVPVPLLRPARQAFLARWSRRSGGRSLPLLRPRGLFPC